jgi:hypothetical protein
MKKAPFTHESRRGSSLKLLVVALKGKDAEIGPDSNPQHPHIKLKLFKLREYISYSIRSSSPSSIDRFTAASRKEL